jgi:hypothetical protein
MIKKVLDKLSALMLGGLIASLLNPPAFACTPFQASVCDLGSRNEIFKSIRCSDGVGCSDWPRDRPTHEKPTTSGKDVDANAEDPAARVRSVYRRLAQVRYYQAQALIRADIPQVKMGDVRAQVEFTAPDQLKIRSTSLALLPKQGFSEFARMITDTSNFTAVDGGVVSLGKRRAQLITVVPGVGMPPDLMLARLWLDERQPLVLRAEMTTRSRGTVQVDYSYGSQAARALPDLMVFTMDVRHVKIPKAMTADLHQSNAGSKAKAADANRPAVVRVELSNYRFSR